MLKRLQKSLDEKDEGFTLIELLVVIVIIGILAAIAIPLFLNQRDKADESAAKSDMKNAATQIETYYVDNNTYVGVDKDYLEDNGWEESSKVTLTIVGATAEDFCLSSTAGTDKTFYYDSVGGGVSETACS